MRPAPSQGGEAKPMTARRSEVGPSRQRSEPPVTSATGSLSEHSRANVHAPENRPGGGGTPPARHRRSRLPCNTNLPPARSQAETLKPRRGGHARQKPLHLEVTIVPMPEPESNPLRARQLAVIVKLLQRAAAEASGNGRHEHEH